MSRRSRRAGVTLATDRRRLETLHPTVGASSTLHPVRRRLFPVCALSMLLGCVVDRSGLATSTDASTPMDGAARRDGAIEPRDVGAPDRPTPDVGVDGGVDSGPPIPSDWFDPAWGERRRLTFDNTPHAEDLVDFPVLVVLDGSRVAYDRAGPAGEQLRFVDPDGTELSFEIEA